VILMDRADPSTLASLIQARARCACLSVQIVDS
jgi:hypothetical protein